VFRLSGRQKQTIKRYCGRADSPCGGAKPHLPGAFDFVHDAVHLCFSFLFRFPCCPRRGVLFLSFSL
jgi:hypothetical protein